MGDIHSLTKPLMRYGRYLFSYKTSDEVWENWWYGMVIILPIFVNYITQNWNLQIH